MKATLIDGNHYRISDKAAGILARGKLPKWGWEKRVISEDKLKLSIKAIGSAYDVWLKRTTHTARTDSPARGWVWAVRVVW